MAQRFGKEEKCIILNCHVACRRPKWHKQNTVNIMMTWIRPVAGGGGGGGGVKGVKNGQIQRGCKIIHA